MSDKKYYEFSNKQELKDHLKFWSSPYGSCYGSLPNELREAYKNIVWKGKVKSLEYLVEFNGRYYAALAEGFTLRYPRPFNKTTDELYDVLRQNAIQLYQTLPSEIILVLGKGTGFESSHEIFFLVPALFSRQTYEMVGERILHTDWEAFNTTR